MKHFSKQLCLILALVLLTGAAALSLADEHGELWLTDEPITFTFWYAINQPSFFADGVNSVADTEVMKWLEEQTNVHIEFIHPTVSTEKESFNLLFADDRLPDFLLTTSTYQYVDGPDRAVEDGYYLRLNELMDAYAPNYMKILNENPKIASDAATDAGLRWGFNNIYMYNGREGNFGPAVRQDFLDRIGAELPVTYDDWHNVLTKFKEIGIEYPLLLNYAGSCDNDSWMSGYGVNRTFFQKDGEVKFGPMEDGYGEYVKMMAQWYKEGLIYPDFALQGPAAEPDDDLVLNDRIGAWATFASWAGTQYYPSAGATNPDFNLVGTYHPVVNVGDELHLRAMDTQVVDRCIAISADCKYPEIAVKWLDIFYNLDYVNVFNYGLREGETYVVNEDGTLSWGDKINNNQEGMTKNQARCYYTMTNAPYEDYSRVMGSWTPEQLESQRKWCSIPDDWELSSFLTPTSDESHDLAVIMDDIESFVLEETTKMIMGTSSYDFESFRSKIRDMGIDRAIAIKQAALDRYNAR